MESPGRTEKVRRARASARQELGKSLDADTYGGLPPCSMRVTDAERITLMPAAQSEHVLSMGEAAARLGLSRQRLVAMADAGRVRTLVVGSFGVRMVPRSEVERLRSGPKN